MKSSPKRPWIAAILACVFPPLGYLYVSWRIGLLSIVAIFFNAVVLAFMNIGVPNWSFWLLAIVFGFHAREVAITHNELTEDELIFADSWLAACYSVIELPMVLGFIMSVLEGLSWSWHLISSGKIIRGIVMLVIVTPLQTIIVTWILSLLVGLIGATILTALDRISRKHNLAQQGAPADAGTYSPRS